MTYLGRVDAEGSRHGDDWGHVNSTWSPGMDWADVRAEFVRRIVAAAPPRGEYDYGEEFN